MYSKNTQRSLFCLHFILFHRKIRFYVYQRKKSDGAGKSRQGNLLDNGVKEKHLTQLVKVKYFILRPLRKHPVYRVFFIFNSVFFLFSFSLVYFLFLLSLLLIIYKIFYYGSFLTIIIKNLIYYIYGSINRWQYNKLVYYPLHMVQINYTKYICLISC